MITLIVTDFYRDHNDKLYVIATDRFNSDILVYPDCDLNNIILIDDILKTAQWRNILWKIESLKTKNKTITTNYSIYDSSYDTYVLVLI